MVGATATAETECMSAFATFPALSRKFAVPQEHRESRETVCLSVHAQRGRHKAAGTKSFPSSFLSATMPTVPVHPIFHCSFYRQQARPTTRRGGRVSKRRPLQLKVPSSSQRPKMQATDSHERSNPSPVPTTKKLVPGSEEEGKLGHREGGKVEYGEEGGKVVYGSRGMAQAGSVREDMAVARQVGVVEESRRSA